MADETPTTQQPVLPPAPWYESPLQVRLVAAGVSQVISCGFRLVKFFGYEIEIADTNVDQLAADLTQLAALGFLGWASWKRQRSALQPLTMTRAAADAKAETSLVDPTTMTKRSG